MPRHNPTFASSVFGDGPDSGVPDPRPMYQRPATADSHGAYGGTQHKSFRSSVFAFDENKAFGNQVNALNVKDPDIVRAVKERVIKPVSPILEQERMAARAEREAHASAHSERAMMERDARDVNREAQYGQQQPHSLADELQGPSGRAIYDGADKPSLRRLNSEFPERPDGLEAGRVTGRAHFPQKAGAFVGATSDVYTGGNVNSGAELAHMDSWFGKGKKRLDDCLADKEDAREHGHHDLISSDIHSAPCTRRKTFGDKKYVGNIKHLSADIAPPPQPRDQRHLYSSGVQQSLMYLPRGEYEGVHAQEGRGDYTPSGMSGMPQEGADGGYTPSAAGHQMPLPNDVASVGWSGTAQSESHASQYHGRNPIVQFADKAPSASNMSESQYRYAHPGQRRQQQQPAASPSEQSSVPSRQMPTTGDQWRAEVDHLRYQAAYDSARADGRIRGADGRVSDQSRAPFAGVAAQELNDAQMSNQEGGKLGVEYRGRTTHDDHVRSSTYSTDDHLSIYPNANFKMKKRVPHSQTPYAPSAEFTAIGNKGIPFAPNPRHHAGVADKMLAMQQREIERQEELMHKKRSPVDAYVESQPNMLEIDENAPIRRVPAEEQARVSGKRFIDPEGYNLGRKATPTDVDHLMMSHGAGIGAAPISVGHKSHRGPQDPAQFGAPTRGSEYSQLVARFE